MVGWLWRSVTSTGAEEVRESAWLGDCGDRREIGRGKGMGDVFAATRAFVALS